MSVNAGKNSCHQIQPYNNIVNNTIYSLYYTCNLLKRKKKKILDEHITPQNMQQDINLTRRLVFFQRT